MKKGWLPLFVVAYIVIKSGFNIRLCHYGLIGSVLSFIAFVGFAYRFPQLNIETDVSYAVYVYHMIVVNAFIALGLVHNIVYLLFVFAITFALGYLSSKTIGAFGLKKKTG